MVWLGVRWRRNYVWLLNRLYMPGALNGLAGFVATVTAVYSQHRGAWGAPAAVVAMLEAALVLVCTVLFVVYNNLLLGKMKRQHEAAQQARSKSGGGGRGFMGKVGKAATDPPFAPGSVV